MGKGKRRGFRKHREASVPKAIVVHVTYQETELLACKTEADMDKLFQEKIDTAMGNFKVDIKKFFGFNKDGGVKEPVKEINAKN